MWQCLQYSPSWHYTHDTRPSSFLSHFWISLHQCPHHYPFCRLYTTFPSHRHLSIHLLLRSIHRCAFSTRVLCNPLSIYLGTMQSTNPFTNLCNSIFFIGYYATHFFFVSTYALWSPLPLSMDVVHPTRVLGNQPVVPSFRHYAAHHPFRHLLHEPSFPCSIIIQTDILLYGYYHYETISLLFGHITSQCSRSAVRYSLTLGTSNLLPISSSC